MKASFRLSIPTSNSHLAQKRSWRLTPTNTTGATWANWIKSSRPPKTISKSYFDESDESSAGVSPALFLRQERRPEASVTKQPKTPLFRRSRFTGQSQCLHYGVVYGRPHFRDLVIFACRIHPIG